MTSEMEVDDQTSTEEKKLDEPKTPQDLNQIAYENLREFCNQLERGEHNIVNRLMQTLNKTRKQLNAEVLVKLCNNYLAGTTSAGQKDLLLSWVPTPTSSGKPTVIKPELELYIHLLVLLYLVDLGKDSQENAVACARNLIERVDQYDKRILDIFLAKAFFYLTLLAERMNTIKDLPQLLSGRLRLATLRNQVNTQATLIVCILRAYLITKNLQSAAKFVEKVSFPESAHNNDMARFYYYQGRIKAMQLEYADAAQFFQLALRKAPQDAAIGFKQNVQKWVVVVSLLQGEIPERSIFRLPIHLVTLAPYLKLAQAVRFGNIVEFNKVLQDFSETFTKDHTSTLIVRLRQNVIKTAIRQISMTYSRIYIRDIAKKLQLGSTTEAEYVVEKAIKEKTIDGCITYDRKTQERYLQSSESQDVYRTTEPQFTFDTRIRSCLDMHNVAVKALRYPSDQKNGDVESIEQQREREIMEMEFASEMADEDDEF
ncbi:PCI domain-containing protein [Ditylenchus destructor]|uniref:PCI domain-containing protein n=1 Tax=Ditylenchus destructor TaxID=166010 RepID=A0AAD4QY48_9BILA|nr:PCI domain-containing protein [Ditylenchus destructor]